MALGRACGAAVMFVREIPGMRLVSEANQREHYMAKHQRAARHRALGRAVVEAEFRCVPPTLPCVVTITKLGAGRVDSDNLAGSAKALRDGIADVLRETSGLRDDGDARVTWVVKQERAPRGTHAVRVEVTW